MNKKTNKKGFTMVELLAVILILGIIAIIATPILTGIISKSRKSSIQRSADFWLKEVRTTIVNERMKGNIMEGKYYINSDGNLCSATKLPCTEPVIIDMTGNKPSNGTLEIESGKIKEDGTTFIIGEYQLAYNEKKGSATKANEIEADERYKLGTPYIIDPGDGIGRLFYVLEDGDNTKLNKSDGSYHTELDKVGTAGKGEVAFILSENITSEIITWCGSQGRRTCNAKGAREYLKNHTTDKGWKVEVNLPTYHQLYNAAVSDKSLNFKYHESYSGYYPLNDWLRGKLYTVENTTLPKGYWTSTASSKETYNSTTGSDRAWVLNQDDGFSFTKKGILSTTYISHQSGRKGIRPVITLKKSDM